MTSPGVGGVLPVTGVLAAGLMDSDYDEDTREVGANVLWVEGRSFRFLENHCDVIVTNKACPQHLISVRTILNTRIYFVFVLNIVLWGEDMCHLD